MKKFLNLLAATALVTTSASTVVSCSSTANWKTFKGWIDKQDSFILYIGARDCEYCQQFETAKDIVSSEPGNSLEDRITSLQNEYNNLTIVGNTQTDDLTGFGQALKSDLRFETFMIDEKANNFREKWSKNILDWAVDQVTNIYIDYRWGSTPGGDLIDTTVKENIAKKVAKNAFYKNGDKTSPNVGTPFFLVVRNGKLVTWTTDGYSESTETNDKLVEFDNWFNAIREDFKNPDIKSSIMSKLEDYSPDASTSESKTNFNYDQIDFNNYTNWNK
ncbi:hypothetical protein SCHIN_v1c08750 [Spiroplasma chinense]|uniref:Lipoprotein n=1 Tax=Spiroplasma chinense TaxID=216932 RepID=A0A5B9Y534_9MOLU|nr:lipoprotein [Spiroplasma chinense]QEH62070.1 hypothetical protein SCHIN_v1c08750 [Spiroplasma chinense]